MMTGTDRTAGQGGIPWQRLEHEGQSYRYVSLPQALAGAGEKARRLPYVLKIVLENVLRQGQHDAAALVTGWAETCHAEGEIPFRPARILMQDFTGVPAVVDLAAMRDGMKRLGGDPEEVNPFIPVDLVIDHSVTVDVAGQKDALEQNVAHEFSRNRERYSFLRWGQQAFDNFRVIPPEAGICHQVNLEYLAPLVMWKEEEGVTTLFPDTVFGTDSHTTMINGLGVLGWGVGGIEAEAAALGEAIAMRLPDVVGVYLEGRSAPGVTATDIVLTLTEQLRAEGVVGKFVEFFGPALDHLPVADRATIANMAPEYGATCGYFPPDALAMDYLTLTGRSPDHVRLVEAYLRQQGLFRESNETPLFTTVLSLDLGTVKPSVAGPKTPSQRHDLPAVAETSRAALAAEGQGDVRFPICTKDAALAGESLGAGDVVLAAITSCTNTSNPAAMLTAGLLARKARQRGMKVARRIKTSLAPGSQAVTRYLERAGLLEDFSALGFEIVGYGCTTCIGNSGPLQADIARTITEHDLTVAAVLSGNRNFEGRVSPHTKLNYITSPPLVMAYALAGTVTRNLAVEPLGHDEAGQPVMLADIWPGGDEVANLMAQSVVAEAFARGYATVEQGPAQWQALGDGKAGATFAWDGSSTYIQSPPWLEEAAGVTGPIRKARILALFGDNITTDHISPAGTIAIGSPAARYLEEHGVSPAQFNSYGSRRGNDRVMARGTFANIRIRNEMIPGSEGGVTRHWPDGEEGAIFDAAARYQQEQVPLVVVAGRNYGMGSSRDWAAKGPRLLGVKAVIAEDFERIHRANLAGMGVLPLTFPKGVTRQTLGLTGQEEVSIDLPARLEPRQPVRVCFTAPDGMEQVVQATLQLETEAELAYVAQGGILPYVLQRIADGGSVR
nr:aconitate hydratase AcnA [Parasaccharibacter sp. TMW 2.1884]